MDQIEELVVQGEIWSSDIKVIFRTITGKWPDAVLAFRNGDVQKLSEIEIKRNLIIEDWHHIYKDRKSLDVWDAEDWTLEYGPNLISIHIDRDICFTFEGKECYRIVKEAASNVIQHRKNKLHI